MNIIDTNVISYILENNIVLENSYYLSPDVVEEVELTKMIHSRKTPKQILEIDKHPYLFDEGIYLAHYKEILNKYGGRSFYNMTGFGDISIIAIVHMLLEVIEIQNRNQLFDVSEEIVVYTNDNGLKNKIITEFSNKNVRVENVNEIN